MWSATTPAKPSILKRTLRIAGRAGFVYLAIVLTFAACQNRLLYFPSHASEAALIEEAASEGLSPWRDAHGSLIGWHRQTAGATRRIVVFHGNAGYAVHRSYYAEALGALGWEVFLFEYPGYGARKGSPGRDAFMAAARPAIEGLLASDRRPLYLLGESIGSGTACSLAAAMPDRIDGLLLVVPFARLVDVARKHFPYLPVSLILRDKYDNIAALAQYRGPVVIALAEADEVIPPEQARALHNAYTGPKLLITFPGGTHNRFPVQPEDPWWREATAFFERANTSGK